MKGNKNNNIFSSKTVKTLHKYAENMYYLRSKWLWSLTMGIFGIAPSRHSAGRHSGTHPFFASMVLVTGSLLLHGTRDFLPGSGCDYGQ